MRLGAGPDLKGRELALKMLVRDRRRVGLAAPRRSETHGKRSAAFGHSPWVQHWARRVGSAVGRWEEAGAVDLSGLTVAQA